MPQHNDDSAQLDELPQHSLAQLSAATIALARRLDAFVADLEKRGGYGRVEIEFKRGVPVMITAQRSFKVEL